MSSALASARKRSLPQPPTPTKQSQPVSNPGLQAQAQAQLQALQQAQYGSKAPPQVQQYNANPGALLQQPAVPLPPQLTLPQIIDVYGRRLNLLEKQVSDITAQPASTPLATQQQQPSVRLDEPAIQAAIRQGLQPFVTEINSRYEMLAQEIANLKDVVMHLQDYTLTVNKRLLEGAMAVDDAVLEQKALAVESTNILDDVVNEVVEQEDGEEEDESHDAGVQFLQRALAAQPEEYELNPGTTV